MNLTLVTAPLIEPVTLTEAKNHMRVELDEDNTLIEGLIVAARQHAERFLKRQLITATWKLELDAFPANEIRVPLPPMQSSTEAFTMTVKYVNTEGTQTTWDSGEYDVDVRAEPGRIRPAYGYTWPSIRSQINAVEVNYQAGYGDAVTDIPEGIRLAIKILVAHWYENRQVVSGLQTNTIPLGAESLLWQDRHCYTL